MNRVESGILTSLCIVCGVAVALGLGRFVFDEPPSLAVATPKSAPGASESARDNGRVRVDAATGMARGASDAIVHVVVFGDARSPLRGAVMPILDYVVERHPDDVRVVW